MSASITILLLENDPVDIKTVKRALQQNGLRADVRVATNGEEGLRYLRRDGEFQDPESSPRPSFILLDLNMPRMNGIEFLRVVKADAAMRKIPVIVLTTSREETDRKSCFDLGVAGYIVKPISFDDFVEAMKIVNAYWNLSELP